MHRTMRPAPLPACPFLSGRRRRPFLPADICIAQCRFFSYHKPMKKVMTDPNRIHEVLTRGIQTLIERRHLETRMLKGERLRVKFGIDPTSPHLHLGHAVPLMKLRQFQDLGHQAVLIIGDGTAMIGDPTGRTEARKTLTSEEIDQNMKTYLAQAGKIVDMDALEVRHNGEWFTPMTAREFLALTSLVTVQQILQRNDFKKRLDDPEHPLSALEITYPLMQGYDSVMVKADVELGGADQELNLLMGRRIQRRYDMREQDIMTVPLLLGTEGKQKMSKTYDNAIFLEDSAEEMFAKLMSVPDEVIMHYFTLLTTVSAEEIEKIEASLQADSVNPRDVKARMAMEITSTFSGTALAQRASETFDRIHRAHEQPEEIKEVKMAHASLALADALVAAELADSKSDARRQIEQGGVKVNDQVVKDSKAVVAVAHEGTVIQKGKRHFVRLVRN